MNKMPYHLYDLARQLYDVNKPLFQLEPLKELLLHSRASQYEIVLRFDNALLRDRIKINRVE